MDVLKVFNLIVCADGGKGITSGWFFNILFAPVGMLMPTHQYAILGWISWLCFSYLIYTSQSSAVYWFNTDKYGNKSYFVSLVSGFFLYTIQTTIIFLFLRYNLCDRTRDWESRDYHLNLQQYNNESIRENMGGYETGY